MLMIQFGIVFLSALLFLVFALIKKYSVWKAVVWGVSLFYVTSYGIKSLCVWLFSLVDISYVFPHAGKVIYIVIDCLTLYLFVYAMHEMGLAFKRMFIKTRETKGKPSLFLHLNFSSLEILRHREKKDKLKPYKVNSVPSNP